MENGPPGSAPWRDVAPERLVAWVDSFARRHGELTAEPGPAVAVFRAADGSVAECQIPFPPLAPAPETPAAPTVMAAADGAAAVAAAVVAGRIAAHAGADRVVGVLLVRLGGYAAGVYSGRELVASKVGSRLVHGRSAAGGTSQRRFARRREKQASEALGAAASCAAAVFGGYAGRLDAVVLGGDKRAMAGLADDPRLRPYFDIAVDRFLTVPDPRQAVLIRTPRMFRAVRVRVVEAPPTS